MTLSVTELFRIPRYTTPCPTVFSLVTSDRKVLMSGPIFGFIERKADFASLLAVVASMAALATQTYWFFLALKLQC